MHLNALNSYKRIHSFVDCGACFRNAGKLAGIIRTGGPVPSSIGKNSIALSTEMVASLRRVWKAAREKKAPYVPADEVMDRLERKYQAIADAAGATD
jgi:hypothetical protein